MARREELLHLARPQPEALVDYVLALERRVAQLERRVEELEARPGQNSSHSHRPPSSDGPGKPKPKSLRAPSGRARWPARL